MLGGGLATLPSTDHSDPGDQGNLRVTSIEPTTARLNAASSTAGFQYSRWCRSPHLVPEPGDDPAPLWGTFQSRAICSAYSSVSTG